jgi:8-oxo-dGTP pyrophosphatase MutT (NUDIX family)
MKKVGFFIGKIVFWVSWPALWLYLSRSKRTRLLLICGDEFLVLRGWLGSGEWALPGGGLHRGEAAALGLIREVREETRIVLTSQDLTFLFTTTQTNKGIRFSYDCYCARLDKKPDIKIQKYEIGAYAWVPLNAPGVRLSADTVYALGQWQNNQ